MQISLWAVGCSLLVTKSLDFQDLPEKVIISFGFLDIFFLRTRSVSKSAAAKCCTERKLPALAAERYELMDNESPEERDKHRDGEAAHFHASTCANMRVD